MHVHAGVDGAASQPVDGVHGGGHGVAVLLGDLVEATPVDTPPDLAILLLDCDQVGGPRAVGLLDDVVAQPLIDLLAQVVEEGWTNGPVAAFDGDHIVGDDAVGDEVGEAVRTVV